MYTRCINCYADLGRNDTVEHLPVGRRLAFDGARGRLWVVCRSCRRWNLTPLEERWEAIETCERLYRATPQRRGTGQIGLARHSSRLELIRIGEPPALELATWRYGELFRRRRVYALAVTAGLGAAGVALFAGAKVLGGVLLLSNPYTTYQMTRGLFEAARARRTALLPEPGGGSLALKLRDVVRIKVVPSTRGERWALRVPLGEVGMRHYYGADALRIAGAVLPRINERGASADVVDQAVRRLNAHPTAEAQFERLLLTKRPIGDGTLGQLPEDLRLAMEMATHAEREQRALDGELEELERAWREAEEVAAIADDMFLPASVLDTLDRLRAIRG